MPKLYEYFEVMVCSILEAKYLGNFKTEYVFSDGKRLPYLESTPGDNITLELSYKEKSIFCNK
jgi:hypothetical protein